MNGRASGPVPLIWVFGLSGPQCDVKLNDGLGWTPPPSRNESNWRTTAVAAMIAAEISYPYCPCLCNFIGERELFIDNALKAVHSSSTTDLCMLFHSFFFILYFFSLTFLNTVFSLSGLDNDRVPVRMVFR